MSNRSLRFIKLYAPLVSSQCLGPTKRHYLKNVNVCGRGDSFNLCSFQSGTILWCINIIMLFITSMSFSYNMNSLPAAVLLYAVLVLLMCSPPQFGQGRRFGGISGLLLMQLLGRQSAWDDPQFS